MHVLWFLLVGLVAGWLAGMLTKGSGFGVLGNMAIGVTGALIGGFLFRLIGLSAVSTLGSIVTSTIGAVVLLVGVKALKKA